MSDSTDLIVSRMEPICRALAEVRDAVGAKQVADLARAAEIYARRQKLGEEAVVYATGVKVDAMTLLGEFLKGAPKNEGAKGIGKSAVPNGDSTSGVVRPPAQEELLGKGGRKVASDAQALVKLKSDAPDLHEQVRQGQLTVPRARQEKARRDQAARPKPTHTPELPPSTYRCIVIDPPWPMQKSERSPRPDQGRALDYATMTLEQIETLPVAKLADPSGCHLYLWVTHRFLPDGLRLMQAWGFTYHCLLTWVKPSGMTPYSWMFNTEHVLFGYSGKFVAGRQGLKVSFDAPAPRGGHSTKPAVFFDNARAFSVGPRLEMFARSSQEGFEGWGNESRR